jgi:hypothetical protein
MRKLILLLVFLLFAALLLASAGTGTRETKAEEQGNPIESLRSGLGDVIVLLNGGANVAYIGDTNTVEVWIKNDAPLTTIDLWFEFIIGRNYQFDPNYGSTGYSNPEGDVQSYLDLHAENAFINNWSPDTLEMGSTDMFPPVFPSHASHVLSYTFQLYIEPNQSELADGLCINCSANPIRWFFNEGGYQYSPTFNGYPHTRRCVSISLKSARGQYAAMLTATMSVMSATLSGLSIMSLWVATFPATRMATAYLIVKTI